MDETNKADMQAVDRMVAEKVKNRYHSDDAAERGRRSAWDTYAVLASLDIESQEPRDDDMPYPWEEHFYALRARTGWVTGTKDPEFVMGLPSMHPMQATEWSITLAGGGPSIELRAEVDEKRDVSRAWLIYQNWGTPWTELEDPDIDDEMLKRVAEGMIGLDVYG